jgi:hypothetical protein
MDFKQALWITFKEKIMSEWQEKYSVFGNSIQELKNTKISFANEVSIDIKKHTKQTIEKGTLNRFFNSDSLVGQVKITTLDIISQYVGYIDWEDFKQRYEGIAPIETPNSLKQKSKISITIPIKNISYDNDTKVVLMFSVIIIIFIISSTFFDVLTITQSLKILGFYIFIMVCTYMFLQKAKEGKEEIQK